MAPGIVLAGGLNPDNVGDAVRSVRPYAVDVSGGVEAAKGIKDSAKIKAFIEEVRSAEQ
jgi:phosphoribosylanthranilate isomerase